MGRNINRSNIKYKNVMLHVITFYNVTYVGANTLNDT